MMTPRLPLHLLFALFATLSFTACIEDDPIDFDDPPTVAETVLQLDGDNFIAPRLDAGIHRFAVRFSESELLDFDGRELTSISVFMAPGATPEYLDLRAYGGGDTQPLQELGLILAELPDDELGRFLIYDFEEPIVIDAEEPLWLEAEVELATAQQTIGCDAGPRVQGGDWLWSEDRYEPFAERVPGESVNWNVRGIVE